MLLRLDDFGHKDQMAAVPMVQLCPSPQVLASLRQARKRIRPGDLVDIDSSMRDPVIDQCVAQCGQSRGLTRSGRARENDSEHVASVAQRAGRRSARCRS